MNKFWFHFTFWICCIVGFLGLFLTDPSQTFVYAQAPATATVTPAANGASAYITQTYSEPVNVRTGPSTVDYPTIGQIPIGAVVPAIASSPHHEWIEIAFPDGPGGVGWIYANFVTLTGTLQVVEPPPTSTPPATATIDPTLAAAFNIQPTVTRLPTFTPAPPLIIPTFTYQTAPVGFPIGGAIFAFALGGVLVLMVSFFGRH